MARRSSFTAPAPTRATKKGPPACRSRRQLQHLVYISVVGADTIPVRGRVDRAMFGYFASKLAAEEIIAESGIPWTTLRSTQFHDFIWMTAEQMARLPVMPIPSGFRFQPVDAGEVADRLVDLAMRAPAGRVADIAACPQVFDMPTLIRGYLCAAGKHRLIVPLRLPGKAAAAYRQGANLAPDRAVGRRTWEEFLADRGDGSRTATAAEWSARSDQAGRGTAALQARRAAAAHDHLARDQGSTPLWDLLPIAQRDTDLVAIPARTSSPAASPPDCALASRMQAASRRLVSQTPGPRPEQSRRRRSGARCCVPGRSHAGPGARCCLVVDLEHCDIGREAVRRRAVRVVFAELEEDVVTRSMMISIERRGAAEAVRSMTWPRPRAPPSVAHHPLGRLPRARFTGGDGVDGYGLGGGLLLRLDGLGSHRPRSQRGRTRHEDRHARFYVLRDELRRKAKPSQLEGEVGWLTAHQSQRLALG